MEQITLHPAEVAIGRHEELSMSVEESISAAPSPTVVFPGLLFAKEWNPSSLGRTELAFTGHQLPLPFNVWHRCDRVGPGGEDLIPTLRPSARMVRVPRDDPKAQIAGLSHFNPGNLTRLCLLSSRSP